MDSNTNLSRSVLRIHGCHTSSLNTSIKSGMVLVRKICDLKLVFIFLVVYYYRGQQMERRGSGIRIINLNELQIYNRRI